jgi:hypothetical protein
MNEGTQPVRGRGIGLSALALVAALTAFLAFAPLASAASDPVASGTTNLKMTKGFFKKMKKKKVKVQAVAGATLKGRTLSFPVSEGEVDPTTGAAVLTHEGGIRFKHGKKKAVVNELVLTSSTATLNGKVAGKRMKFGAVVGYTFARSGFDVTINATRVKMTKRAAKQLNKKLGFPVKAKKKKQKNGKKKTIKPTFVANEVVGSAAASTSPRTVTVLSGAAALKTSEETTKKMVLPPPNGFAIEIAPVEPTQLEPDEANPFTPTLKFPVKGGTVAPNATAGKVETAGGVKLVQELAPGKVTTMTLNAITVDLDSRTATVEVSVESTIDEKLNLGNLGRSSIATVDLTGATITSDGENHRVTVTGASSALQAVTAETLNSVFGAPWDALEIPHPTFNAGDPLGTFDFTVQTQ